jgi:hypothetical protein
MRFEFGPWGVDLLRGRIREDTFEENIKKMKHATSARRDDLSTSSFGIVSSKATGQPLKQVSAGI